MQARSWRDSLLVQQSGDSTQRQCCSVAGRGEGKIASYIGNYKLHKMGSLLTREANRLCAPVAFGKNNPPAGSWGVHLSIGFTGEAGGS